MSLRIWVDSSESSLFDTAIKYPKFARKLNLSCLSDVLSISLIASIHSLKSVFNDRTQTSQNSVSPYKPIVIFVGKRQTVRPRSGSPLFAYRMFY